MTDVSSDLLSDSVGQVRHLLDHIRALYATVPVGLCLLDPSLRFKSMNEHLALMVGHMHHDVEGKTMAEVLGEPAGVLEPLCSEAASKDVPVLNREVIWRPSGSENAERHWLCSFYPIHASDGTIPWISAVIQDITAHRHSELEMARLEEIVAASHDAIIGKTLDGIITSWNRGAERMYDYRADEVIGRPISIIVPIELKEEAQRILDSLRSGKRIEVNETIRVGKDGRRVHVSRTISPIKDSSGQVVAASSIERDITARRRIGEAIRNNESHVRFILHSARVGTWDWDISTGRMHWSDNLEELHGRQPGSFPGTYESAFKDVYPDDLEIINSAIADALKGSGDYQVEYRIVHPDGSIYWLEEKGQVIKDAEGNPVRMAGICMDITERKKAEEALRISEMLLRSKADELAVAHRQKDEFLAMLAHELRNPLAPISNAVQLLKMQETGNHPDFLPRAVAIIDRQVEQIARLVDDLLDVARITRGRIDLKKELVGLTDIMKQAVETVTPVMQMNEHTFRVSFPRKEIILNADATRMIQVISNLLNNAAKFTPKGGEIVLSAAREGDVAAISVTDNGVGISPDMLPHVFELFTQEDRSLDRRQGGLGLGLSLVKRLVEMHSGTVEAESAGTGRGSRFTVRLPIAAESAEVSDLGSSGVLTSTSAARKLRILVVDDNVESAEAMAMLLRTLGHEVTAAHSGQQALNAAQQNMPEVVFLDIGLPVMDGYEVARRLRAAYGRERLMLVALTGYAQNPDDTRVQQAQFDHYVLKPLSFEHLQSLLSEWPN